MTIMTAIKQEIRANVTAIAPGSSSKVEFCFSYQGFWGYRLRAHRRCRAQLRNAIGYLSGSLQLVVGNTLANNIQRRPAPRDNRDILFYRYSRRAQDRARGIPISTHSVWFRLRPVFSLVIKCAASSIVIMQILTLREKNKGETAGNWRWGL